MSSIDFPSFGLSIPMPETLPAQLPTDAPAVIAEGPAAEAPVELDSAAVELATVVFDFISQFSSFSNIVAPETETPSEPENSQPDSETVAKNDFLDSLAEVFKHTTSTISDFFHPVLEKLGNLANLFFKNPMDSEGAKPTPSKITPSHTGKVGCSNLLPKGTSFTGRIYNMVVPRASYDVARGCSIAR
jgi:hypothetical protein